MTVEVFAKKGGFNAVCMTDPGREISGVYIGDLLSWVMGRAEPGNVWITIMSNINTVAVATLADVSCILLADGVLPDPDALEAARAKGVNILSAPIPSYEAAIKLSELLA